MPTRPSAIVIAIDRLGTGFLGPYGNTWVETPALNRLASESLLWEYCLATNPTLAGAYRSFGTGAHPFEPDRAESLWNKLRTAGVHSVLVSDEPELQQLGLADQFAEHVQCPPEQPSQASASPEETGLAHVFLAALEQLEKPRHPFCLWLHARGMQGPWDAPYEYREQFADEEDPDPPTFLAPPDRILDADSDPDELLGCSHAYAAQVVVLDMCLELFLDHLRERGLLDTTLVLFTGVRGYPLGEHGGIGKSGDGLYEETLHVPLLIRRPDKQHALVRCQTLTQPGDLHAALAKWFELEPGAEENAINLLEPADPLRRQSLVSTLGESRSIRTPAWFSRQSPAEAAELFAKPDDRWEVNEVAARGSDVVEELAAARQAYESLAAAGRLADLPPLEESLLHRVD